MHKGQAKEGPSIQLLKEALINTRQHETFLRIILNDVISCAHQVQHLQEQLAVRMKQLQATVQSKTAVPTAQVYPQFIHLAQIWSGFQDEMVLLSVLSNILVSLEPFTRGHRELFTDEALAPFLDGITILTDEQRIQQSSGDQNRVDCKKEEVRRLDWLFPETTKNFHRLPLQYRGYCGWTLVKYDRLLIPANPLV